MIKHTGLSEKEVQLRKQNGQINILPKPATRSNSEIIIANVFTLFNLYNFAIAAALLYARAYTSLFFIGIVISNTIMFTAQEIRSRNLVQKLNILVAPTTQVVRNGELQSIDNESLVLDDIVYYQAGDQISADSIILDGRIEVNESLLTGEIHPVDKTETMELLSGSFVISGTCYARIFHVGEDNYAIKITHAAKKQHRSKSELLATFQKVTYITSFFIIPIGMILLYQGWFVRDDGINATIVNTATALLGMLPQGLVLLTTVSLIQSVIKLGTRKTLVQDLYAIEVLSQADVLCLDKTGTLTQGNMKVIETSPLEEDAMDYLQNFVGYANDNNTTFNALQEAYESKQDLTLQDRIPFSSQRKWSAVLFHEINIIIGAPEILMPHLELPEHFITLRHNGARVLLCARTQDSIDKDEPLPELHAFAWIAIQDTLREDAHEAVQFFKENNVTVKVISGDNPITVSSIAMQAGVENAEAVVDASTLTSESELRDAIMNHNVIGRSSPNQKLDFIRILQESNHKVAMTGDGINDVLALKNSNCSIAMGEGSDAALFISQIVIMDGKLSTLVDVVKEGRQVINNITRSASMYYLRTIISVFMAVIAISLNVAYPFFPFQITLSNMFIDGFPSFMILFERNISKPKERILNHVLRHSVPNATAIIILWMSLNLFNLYAHLPQSVIQTIMFYVNGYISIHMIYRIYKPLNWYRAFVLVIDVIGFALGIALFWSWLKLTPLQSSETIMTLVMIMISHPLVYVTNHWVDRYLRKKKTRSL